MSRFLGTSIDVPQPTADSAVDTIVRVIVENRLAFAALFLAVVAIVGWKRAGLLKMLLIFGAGAVLMLFILRGAGIG